MPPEGNTKPLTHRRWGQGNQKLRVVFSADIVSWWPAWVRPGAGGGSLKSVPPSQSCSRFQNFKQNPNYLIFFVVVIAVVVILICVCVCTCTACTGQEITLGSPLFFSHVTTATQHRANVFTIRIVLLAPATKFLFLGNWQTEWKEWKNGKCRRGTNNHSERRSHADAKCPAHILPGTALHLAQLLKPLGKHPWVYPHHSHSAYQFVQCPLVLPSRCMVHLPQPQLPTSSLPLHPVFPKSPYPLNWTDSSTRWSKA